MKDSFILYTKYRKQFEGLTNEQKGILFDAILAYASEEPLPEMDSITNLAFTVVKFDLDANAAKYEEKCEQNRKNIGKRWHTDEYDRIRPYTKHTDNDSDSDIKRKNKQKRKVNSFDNFPQRAYNMAELEKQLRG